MVLKLNDETDKDFDLGCIDQRHVTAGA